MNWTQHAEAYATKSRDSRRLRGDIALSQTPPTPCPIARPISPTYPGGAPRAVSAQLREAGAFGFEHGDRLGFPAARPQSAEVCPQHLQSGRGRLLPGDAKDLLHPCDAVAHGSACGGRNVGWCALNPHRRCHNLHSNYMLNRGYAYTTIISSKYQGQTLLFHLASLYPHSTPQAWQQKLNNGEVTLNGVTATGRESVALGQTLVWNRPPWMEPDSPQHFEVLFEDRHLLAVDKPGGLPTLPGGGFMENTLLRLVQKQTPNANPVHRLGRATTGIVLFAKTTQAASHLFANWNTPRIQKIYRALAQNVAQHDAYEILTPIGLVPHPLIGFVWAAHPCGKPAGKPSKSLAKVISRTTSTTTFEVSLNSGRPHQIRIHLASIGHPLVGDPLYGSTGQPLENLPGLPGDGGYLLHAQCLKFHHPITGEQINLEAALPSGF